MSEYIESTRKGKLYFYGFLLLTALVALGLDQYTQSMRVNMYTDSLSSAQILEEIEKDAKTSLFIILAMQPILWFISYLLYQFGDRIKVSGQYPPPDAQMPFRTKVQKGKMAHFQAIAVKATAALLILVGFMLIYLAWFVIQSLERMPL